MKYNGQWEAIPIRFEAIASRLEYSMSNPKVAFAGTAGAETAGPDNTERLHKDFEYQFPKKLLVASFVLLVAMPGAPSSVRSLLVASLLLLVRPLLLEAMHLFLVVSCS